MVVRSALTGSASEAGVATMSFSVWKPVIFAMMGFTIEVYFFESPNFLCDTKHEIRN
jgi:hypothetical protein